MKFKRKNTYWLVPTVVLIIYFNANFADFVFDDVSAIKDNKDLRPSSDLLGIFTHDFWGTPMSKEHSHKSYRPICVLTFRINYFFHELNPVGYHFVNILLHSLVCLLYHRFLSSLMTSRIVPFISTLLFAVHPIHTEAVTGVVGRAELLSSIFFLFTLMIYQRATLSVGVLQKCCCYTLCLLTVALAMFSKEQGVTVLGICFVYELFFVQKVLEDIRRRFLSQPNNNNKLNNAEGRTLPSWRNFIERTIVLTCIGVLLILVRLKVVMGSTLPVFTSFDNPAAHEPAPTKQLTWTYLLAKNFWLLTSPNDLCCDWTMRSIPLVTSLADPRNLSTIIFVVGFLNVVFVGIFRRGGEIVLLSVAMAAIPFLPASNLFFPVGFVIAERVLYIPSMGFCLLVSYGFSRLCKQKNCQNRKWILESLLVFLISGHAAKTFLRNFDWKDESSIFLSGIRVNGNNAKLWNNVGHALESKGRYDEALKYFNVAAQVQPDDVGAHINVGRTLNNLGKYEKAEKVYLVAKSLLPQPKKGQRYTARIAPQHLSVFLNLANLIARNPNRLEEADVLYRQAISMRADYVQAYINRGDVLIKMGRPDEAKSVYETALAYDSNNADLHYNIGVVHIELGHVDQAQEDFSKALQIDPDHVQSLMNSAILMQSTGKPEMRPLAYQRLFRVLKLSPNAHSDRVYFNLGMLAMDDGDAANAEVWFKKAVEIKPNFRSALFNLALLLNEQKRPLDALPFLVSLHSYYPDHIKGLILMGDIYTNHVKDLKSAERCYRHITEVDPNHIQGHHNLCVVQVEQGYLEQARECLVKVMEMAPNEDYVKRHLQIVENRIRAAASTTTATTTTIEDN